MYNKGAEVPDRRAQNLKYEKQKELCCCIMMFLVVVLPILF